MSPGRRALWDRPQHARPAGESSPGPPPELAGLDSPVYAGDDGGPEPGQRLIGEPGGVLEVVAGDRLDCAPAAIEVLPEIVDAVQGRAEVLLDSGIRRGSDIVKALALGARAVMVGRPHLYGLARGGQDGVAQALGILRDELDRCLALIGCPRVADLDRSYVAWGRPPDA